MRRLFATDAWLPDGWAHNVRIDVDASGMITRLEGNVDAPGDGLERIDGTVLPGLCDLHSHAFQRALAGFTERSDARAAGDSFWTWRETMYSFAARMNPEQLESIAAQAYLELLKGGYTSVCEFHYLHRDIDGAPYADAGEMAERIVAAAAQVNIGLTLLPVLYLTSNFGGSPPHAGQRRFLTDPQGLLRLIADMRQRHGRAITVGAAPHSLRAVPPVALDDLVSGLDAMDDEDQPRAPLHIHIAEQTKEVDDCLAWSGARPVQWLLHAQPVGPQWCLVHATHITAEETQALAASRAVVGLCPTTEANLGDGLFPLSQFAGHDGVWGIGSDSNVSSTAMEELRWLEYGQRLLRRQRNVMAPPGGGSVGEALYGAALRGGAQASGRPIAGLQVGQRADLVVLDPDHPSWAGKAREHRLDALVFCGHANPIRDVMVGGQWSIRNGRHAQEDRIAARFGAAVRALAQA